MSLGPKMVSFLPNSSNTVLLKCFSYYFLIDSFFLLFRRDILLNNLVSESIKGEIKLKLVELDHSLKLRSSPWGAWSIYFNKK